jgi:hypothetical protein
VAALAQQQPGVRVLVSVLLLLFVCWAWQTLCNIYSIAFLLTLLLLLPVVLLPSPVIACAEGSQRWQHLVMLASVPTHVHAADTSCCAPATCVCSCRWRWWLWRCLALLAWAAT